MFQLKKMTNLGISEGNNIENIPWSQQVDEALTDLSSNYTEKGKKMEIDFDTWLTLYPRNFAVSDGADVNASNLQCNNINLNVENKVNEKISTDNNYTQNKLECTFRGTLT